MAKKVTHKLDLAGDLSLQHAGDLLERLKTALAEHANVVIDNSKLTSIDFAVVQLLVSAHKSAVAASKVLTLSDPGNDALQKTLKRAGFIGPDGAALTPEAQFWTTSANQAGSDAP
jgi:anti-anti-sigma regulatory factor